MLTDAQLLPSTEQIAAPHPQHVVFLCVRHALLPHPSSPPSWAGGLPQQRHRLHASLLAAAPLTLSTGCTPMPLASMYERRLEGLHL